MSVAAGVFRESFFLFAANLVQESFVVCCKSCSEKQYSFAAVLVQESFVVCYRSCS